MLRYTANAVTATQARIMGCDAQDITIYVAEVLDDGNEEHTETIEIAGPTPDVDAIEDLLAQAGWRVVGDIDATTSNQVWAIVERA